MTRKFYITTAIDYANDEPHLGTAYEKVGADVIARFRRLEGDDVHFQTGNDEHSINVQRAAAEAGLPPKEYCDRRSATNRALWQRLGISFDNFIQTSEPRHHETVRALLDRLYRRGHIYKGRYRGLYCESCEAFYLPKDLVDGKCPDHDRPPAEIEEDNYFFSLSSYRDDLLALFTREPQRLVPEVRRNEITSRLRSGLDDISISRATATWGIPLPWDPEQVTYVWFDALINYLTAVGYGSDEERFRHWWPADLHVIGKSITFFHAIIWPAMLLAADLPLFSTVFSHGFIYLKGRKMSKSLGNVVRPLDLIDAYGADPLRYYVLCEGSFGRDRDFLWENFIHRYNSDLGNDLGNLVQRTLSMIQRYLGGRLRRPADGRGIGLAREDTLRTLCLGAPGELRSQLDPQGDDLNFHLALQAIWRIVDAANKYVGEAEPWRLAKQGESDRVAAALYVLAESLRFVAILLAPFLPETGARMWRALGLETSAPFGDQRFAALTEWGWLPDGPSVEVGTPLFPRITVVPEEEAPATGQD